MDTVQENKPEPSPAELRRTLRTKKILECAKSRLEKLNGKKVDENHTGCSLPETRKYSDPEVDPDTPISTPSFQEEFPANLFGSVNTQTTKNNTFSKSRVHIFLASFLGYALSYYTQTSVFIPAGLLIITELIYFRGQQPTNVLGNMIVQMLILFTGSTYTKTINKLTKILSITYVLLVDLAVHIFCICSLHYLLSIFRSSNVV